MVAFTLFRRSALSGCHVRMFQLGGGDISWLKTYLQRLPGDVDADVIAEYITSIVHDSELSKDAMCSEISVILSAYLADDSCEISTSDIMEHFTQLSHVGGSESKQGTANETSESDMIGIEERMRILMQENYEKQMRVVENQKRGFQCSRDACTTAVLRAAGVAGYQGDSEEEKNVEIAVTNAEFQAKQQLDAACGKLSSSLNDTPELVQDGSETDIDLDELESTSGYGKKDEVKPGTVEDALSVLNPSLFGSYCLAPVQPCCVSSTRLLNSCPRPVSFEHPVRISPSDNRDGLNLADESKGKLDRPHRPDKIKKAVPASRHIAKVGAQAEARQKTDSKHSERSAKSETVSGAVRIRLDEMDAFLFSDSEDCVLKDTTSAELPEGGSNRDCVIAAEQATRQAASNVSMQRKATDKTNRVHQLEQATQRKQTTQKRAQKVERRC
ncbi:hypothetical protein EG68_08362 [Paragonimus skrjabini miyazakii]|uniref:Coiled-coil domain-containing protein 43 n=1 Tax=Paragonimus skrjabini miyazakii TaxID=59628 RepID=A0A8S9YHY0_9TREM|nr:hypothetical protein EG68_08362 [Paragonimus skrjabini miyazakii]